MAGEVRCGDVGNGKRCVFINLGRCEIDLAYPMTPAGRTPTRAVDCICHCNPEREKALCDQLGLTPEQLGEINRVKNGIVREE